MINNIPLTPVKTLIKTITNVHAKKELFHEIDMDILLQRTANRLKNKNNDAWSKINILYCQSKDNMLNIYNNLICKKKIIDPRTFGTIIDQFSKFMYQIETIDNPSPENIISVLDNTSTLRVLKAISDDDVNQTADRLVYNIAHDAATYKTSKDPYSKISDLIAKSYFLAIIDNQIKTGIYDSNSLTNALNTSTEYIKNIFGKHPDVERLINVLSFQTYLYLTSFDDKFESGTHVSCDYSLVVNTPKEKNTTLSGTISGETDFNSDTRIVDLKISNANFKPEHIMQVGLYYLLSANKETITELALYNPLLNQAVIVSPENILKTNDIGKVIETTTERYLEKTSWMKK